MLTALSISDFAARLASPEPAPGGGSAAALSGLMAASLMQMVISLSVDRAELSEYNELFLAKQTELVKLYQQMERLIDVDAEAFNTVMTSLKLPKTTDTEKRIRTQAIQDAYRKAAEVPLETARACLGVMEIGRLLLGKINQHTVSDLAVGALSAYTGVMGALYNTAINLPSLTDRSLVKALAGQVHLIRHAADELLAAIQSEVHKDAAFQVMEE